MKKKVSIITKTLTHMGKASAFGFTRTLFALLILLSFNSGSKAQSYDEIGVNTTVSSSFGPIYRVSATSTVNYSSFAYLYLATELNIPNGAIIYRIDWHAESGTSGITDSNYFRIDLQNTTQSTISQPSNNWNSEVAGATMVYSETGYQIQPGGGWIPHLFSTPFTYNGGNLKVLTDHFRSGTATGEIRFHYETKTGLAAGASATTNTRGTTFSTVRSNGRPDIRIYYAVPNQGTDVTANALLSPSSKIARGSNTPIKARIANMAGNAVTSMDITYQIDNSTPVTEAWTGTLNPGTYTDFTFTTQATLPNSHFTNIRVWVSDINGAGADDIPDNDSLIQHICMPLTGNYTIGPDPSDDFPSFNAAIDALNCGGGITGPVHFLVKEGTYNERVVLTDIPGASSTNSITFRGEDPATTILQHVTTVSADRVAFTLEGAKHITLDSFTIDVSDANATYGWAIRLSTGTENIRIRNMILRIDSAASSTNYNGIMGVNSATSESSSATINGLLIEKNTIIGGNHGIRLYGSSSLAQTNVIIRDNIIRNQYAYGIYLYYTSSPGIERNVIDLRSGIGSNISGGGVYFSTVSGPYLISHNKITNAGLYGIYITGGASNSASPSLISNNLIGGGFRSTANTCSGINIAGTTAYINIYHNSVLMDGSIGSALNIRSANVTNLRIINNSFSYTGASTGYAMYLANLNNAATLNYNNYHVNGSRFVYLAADRANMAALRAVNTPVGNDVNSLAVDPGYTGALDLRLLSPSLVGKGTSLAAVTDDYFGNPRSLSTPVIGAHEFAPKPFDAGVTSIIGPFIACPGSSTETVSVTIQNFGIETLTNIPVNYQINGGTVIQEILSGPLASNTSVTFNFATTVNLTGAGPFNLKVWTSLGTDGANDNDSNSIAFTNGLTGPNYTVGGSSSDYATLNDAVNDLIVRGVCAPVTFLLQPGSFTERIVIPAITGASATNTITFKGVSQTGSVITHSPTVTTDRAAIVLDGAEHIIIDSLTINVSGGTFGWGIQLINQAGNNIIRNNRILMSTTTTSTNFIGIVSSISLTATTGGNASHDNLIENNYVLGGYTGIGIYGATAARQEGIEVRNNIVDSFHYYGIYMGYAAEAIVDGNIIIQRLSNPSVFGTSLYFIGPGPFVVTNNNIINAGQNGIMITTSNVSGTTRSLLANNMVGGIMQSTSNLSSGIRIISSSEIDVFFNTVNMTGSEGAGLYLVSSATSIDVRNNLFAFTGRGAGFAALYESSASLIANDYNNYYSTGVNFVSYGGTPVADLNALIAINAPAGNDLHSLQLNPYFISAEDLRVTRIAMNGKGTPLTRVTTDIFGTTRNATNPAIGAHEFVPLAIDAGISGIISPVTTCGLTNSESLQVEIINYGSNVLTSIPVSYRLNGGTVTQETATVNLTINDLHNHTFSVPVTLNGFGPFHFEMWTELSGDMNQRNDTFRAVVYKTLDGTFTIGGSNPDFNTISEMVNVISNAGICGPVEFRLAPGVYNERLILRGIRGASSTNTITIKGVDPVNSIIKHHGTVVAENAAILIHHTPYVTIDSLTVDVMPPVSNTSHFGWGIHLRSGSAGAVIRNTRILADTLLNNSTGSNYAGIVITDSTYISTGVANSENILIENNYIQGGSYGIYAYGINTSKPAGYIPGLRILNNQLFKPDYYGIDIYYSNAPLIMGNEINMRITGSFQYAIYLYTTVGSFRVSKNKIYNSSSYGIAGWYNTGDPANPSYIDNNMIGAGFRTRSNTAVSGIRLFSGSTDPTSHIRIVHNSINMDANSGSALNITTGNISGIEIMNNIFSATGGQNGFAMNINAAAMPGISRLNNNNYFSNGNNFVTYNAVALPNLAALRAINIPAGNDSNSLNEPTGFLTGTDLRTTSPAFYLKGTAIPQVNTDFYGNSRNPVSPTMGAFEFTPKDNDVTVAQILSPGVYDCGDSLHAITVVIKNTGLNPQNNIPVTVDIKGTHTVSFTEYITDPLTFGESDTFTFANRLNFQTGANIDISVFTSLVGDDDLTNDTIKYTSRVNARGVNPIVLNDTVCVGGDAVLKASATSGIRAWYNDLGDVLPFASGIDSISLNDVSSDQSLFVENIELAPTVYRVGPVDNTIGTTSTAFFSDAEIFNAHTNVFIDSVKLITDVAGNITVGLLDAAGNVIATRNLTLDLGTKNYHLGFVAPRGNGYRLSMRSSTTGVRLFRNTAGAIYPYEVPGLISITGTTNTNQAYYYFFYDLQVRSYCASERLEVKALINTLPVNSNIAPSADFQGTYAAGGVENIDLACAGDTLVYLIKAPDVYDNSTFGDQWDISAFSVATVNGTATGNPVLTPPVSGNDATLAVNASVNDGDSVFVMNITYTTKEGCDITLTRYIYVSPKPQANFTVADICLGDIASFTNSTSMQGNLPVTYTWNFGDGNSSGNDQPVHNYTTAGTFQVELIATAQVGCPDTLRSNIVVHDVPVAAFTAADSTCGNQVVLFTNTSNHQTGAGFVWNFGDGNTTTDENPSHLFTQPGTYPVSLIVSQTICADTFGLSVRILPAPQAGFNANDVCFGDSVLFNNQSAGSSSLISGYQWDFGDGESSQSLNPVYRYDNAGTYSVTLATLANNGCADTFQAQVTVNALPDAGFTTSFGDNGGVNFEANESGLFAYVWNFGDGRTGSGENTFHRYLANGTYSASLKVTSQAGCQDSSNQNVQTINVSVADLAHEMGLEVYPNPFTSATGISYTLHETADISLNVYDVNGKLVQSLHTGKQAGGKYQFRFDNEVNGGVYLVKLTVNGETYTRRIVKLN